MELHQFAIAAENSSKRLRQLWHAVAPCHRQAAEAVSGVSAHGEHGLSHHWNDTLPVDKTG